ncbi:hypothetical protein Z043_108064 [Scleropages formosus]|uniref:AMP-binding enzyme C-terminal domain-containing protein n=1 Tax=Scleropages formosus TaxID=113540 RepID=A0A0P7YXH7_SCLFO|nr:hypothetical protein Z043_108064 [Scleropages formosus]
MSKINEQSPFFGYAGSKQLTDKKLLRDVFVKGNEGRAGMTAIIIKPDRRFDGKKLFQHVLDHLPSYARPLFVRIQETMEVTGTLKQLKFRLVESGFNPSMITEAVYFLDYTGKCYVPLTNSMYNSIVSGQQKL